MIRPRPGVRAIDPGLAPSGAGLTGMSQAGGHPGRTSRELAMKKGKFGLGVGGGTAGASRAIRMGPAAALTALCLAGCVTQNIQFELPEDLPPAIASSPRARHPLHEILRVEEAVSDDDGGGVSREIRLDVDVRDPNLDQRLQLKIFLDFNAADPLGARVLYEASIPPSGALARPVSVSLPRAVVEAPGCHRLELFVSGAFLPAPRNREPAFEGDLATATWWVASGPAPVDMTRCP